MPTAKTVYIGQPVKKSVMIDELIHARLTDVAHETAMPMYFWATVAVRFFLGHVGSKALIENARGLTIEEYNTRIRGLDAMVERMLAESMEPGSVLATERGSTIDEPPKPLIQPREGPRVVPAFAQPRGRALAK